VLYEKEQSSKLFFSYRALRFSIPIGVNAWYVSRKRCYSAFYMGILKAQQLNKYPRGAEIYAQTPC